VSDSTNLPDDWSARIAKGMAESEAKRFFEPVEQVAHFRSVKRDDWRLECRVRFAGVDRYDWHVLRMQKLGEYEAMHGMRSGHESTREAACLAAYNAAKEMADDR
jgi:hypothetical protein